MSYTKNRMIDLATVHAEMQRSERRYEDEQIERLRWEVDRAVSNLVEALMRREQRRNDEAGRQADEAIRAGHTPF